MELSQALKEAGRKGLEAQKTYEIIEAAILAQQLVKELAGEKEKLETAIGVLQEEWEGLQGQADKVKETIRQLQAEAKQDWEAGKAEAARELEGIKEQIKARQEELAGVAGRLEEALAEMDRQVQAKKQEADQEEARLQAARYALAEFKGRL
ncbi:MAG: hypothetical protein A2Y80_08870 [Deltaproteobacteria bacterium RBG_13_58_19]|nr:MAG: hypothetical protein A2Y80_08870 [Deltaproteobacteria bacterium RBG_13_58_19]